jgi:hypothetical protein
MKGKSMVAYVSYRNIKAVPWLISLLLLAGAIAQAQMSPGSFSGIVSDASGAAVPGATVTVTDIERGVHFAATTDNAGVYFIKELIPSTYKITAEASGFRTYVVDSFPLSARQEAVLNITLQLGPVNQTVEVKSQVQMVEPSNATLGGLVNNAQVVDLPLVNRNVLELIAVQPGVAPSTPNSYTSTGFTSGCRYGINGGLECTSDFSLDGVSLLTQADNSGMLYLSLVPSVESIQEMSVETHNYSATYGRSGGGITTMVTKSGTDRFHGSLFDFTQTNNFEANGFFSNETASPIPALHWDQYGASVGGPVIKKKLFFFADYERNLNHAGTFSFFTVPTAAERQGDFSQDYNSSGQLIQIYNPFSTRPDPSNPGQYIRDPVPGNNLNNIPGHSMDPVALKAIAYYPLPNLPGTPIPGTNLYTVVNNFASTANASSPVAQLNTRADINFSSNARGFLRFGYMGSVSGAPWFWGSTNPAGNSYGNGVADVDNIALGYTRAFGPRTVLDLRAGVSRTMFLSASQGVPFNQTTLGLPQGLQTYELAGAGGKPEFPGFMQEGYSTMGCASGGCYFIINHADWTFSGNLSRVIGKHTLTVGADNRDYFLSFIQTFVFENSFSNDMTQGPNPRVVTPTAGDSIASFLLGTGDSGNVGFIPYTGNANHYFAEYIQDDFKVTPKLTLNLGFRVEEETKATERFNRMARIDLDVLNPISQQVGFNVYGGYVFAGHGPDSYGGRAAGPMDLKPNPRIGLAYSLNNKMVIRAGYGLFYGISPYAATNKFTPPSAEIFTPWLATLDGITPNNLLSNPFPTGFVYPPGNSQGLLTAVGTALSGAYPNGSMPPYNSEGNLTIQRSLSSDIMLQLAYVINKGTHLNVMYPDIDQLPLQDEALGNSLLQLVPNPFAGLIPSGGTLDQPTVERGQQLLPWPGWTSVGPLFDGWGNSDYNAMQVMLQKRFTNGTTFNAGYTWSKLMADVTDGTFNDGGLEWWSGGSSSIRSIYCLRCERSVSSYDVPHRFTFSGVGALPFGKGKRWGSNASGLLNQFVGGWQANGILTLASGQPNTITTAVNTSYSFGGGQHPNLVGNPVLPKGQQNVNEWFNTAAFAQPANFTFGNLGRNIDSVRQDWTRNLDFSLFKNFSIKETAKLQFRAEAFNLFNTPIFGTPNSYSGAPGFGAIAYQSNMPRIFQLALKFIF